MHSRTLILVLSLAACGDDAPADLPDAAMPDVAESPHCPAVPATPTAPGRHVLFVNTDGVTLTKAAGPDDARANLTVLIMPDTVVVPRFLDATSGREDFINELLRLTRVRLAPFSIDVVTTRPASGDYYMSVIGGDPTAAGLPAGVASIAPGVCSTANRNHVSLVFDRHFQGGASGYAYSLLSDLGAMVGLSVTREVGDCMCRFDGCVEQNVCAFGTGVTTAPGSPDCGRGPVQDEQALLKIALGCR